MFIDDHTHDRNYNWSFIQMRYDYKYSTFKDYFEEIENYCLRLERFHDEFSEPMKVERAIEWLEAAFKCGREMQKVKEIND
jgi:hypothetical protein